MRYFFKGHIVEVKSDTFEMPLIPEPCVITYISDAAGRPCYPYEMVTSTLNLEPIAEQTYKVGDYVKLIDGDYTGVVIGFEPKTNHVLTAPVRTSVASMQHVRYSHSAAALEVWDRTHIHIKPGRYYVVNHSLKCMAVKVDRDVSMFVTSRGELAFPKVPSVATSLDLLAVGIHYLKETTK